MKKGKPLVDKDYKLQKIPGKGGWTYVAIPEISPDKRAKFGWIKVTGSIDTFQLKEYRLMPMGDGKLFLPVRAEIRKVIKKKEGDTVRVILYHDKSVYKIPQEIKDCFALESEHVYKNFLKLTEGQQKMFVDWVYKAKRADTRTNRIMIMMERVANGEKYPGILKDHN